MWPFRPQRLTDVLPDEDIRQLLRLGGGLGAALTLVERTDEDSYRSLGPPTGEPGEPSDPFCTFFRRGTHGGKLAFVGADEACTQCEQRFARRFLHPAISSNWPLDESGVAKARCHMGLTDYLVPVRVAGKVVAGLIAGRRVESDDERQRIRKTAGKLGKLTRAEAEGPDPKGHIVIQPADDKVRDRLLHEIQSIPLSSESFQVALTRLSELIGRFAERQYLALRWAADEEVVEGVHRGLGAPVESSAALRRDTEEVLDRLRETLQVEFLGLFAWMTREIEERKAHPSLVAASGLPWTASRRLLELDWSRLPSRGPGPRGDYLRGIESVSAVINAAVPTRDTPDGLKDKLTKCLFISVADVGETFPAALAFGPRVVGAGSGEPGGGAVELQEGDLDLLVRVARAVARRYYAGALDAERHWMAHRLSKEAEVRQRAEDARKAAQETLRKAEEERRLQARTRGFSHFDFRKLVDQCLERTRPMAQARGLEFDDRALPERLLYDGDRPRLVQAIEELLLRCVDRSLTDSPAGKPAPVRVFLKRARDFLVFGAEAVGEYFDGAERRTVFSREETRGRRPRVRGRREISVPQSAVPAGDESKANESKASDDAPSQPVDGVAGIGSAPRAPRIELPATLGGILVTARRHGGRLRVESERLRRLEGDVHQWLGRTSYTLELPFWGRSAASDRDTDAGDREGTATQETAGVGSAARPKGRRRRTRRSPTEEASAEAEGPNRDAGLPMEPPSDAE